MTQKIEGEFAKWKKEQRTEAFNQGKTQGKAEGITQGEENIILELLNKFSIQEVSKMVNKDELKYKK